MKNHRLLFGVLGIVIIVFISYFLVLKPNSPLEGKEIETGQRNLLDSNDTVEIVRQSKMPNPITSDTKVMTIEKAVLCLNVENQSPIGTISQVPSEVNRVFCWTRFINGKGEKIRYLWYFDGKITASGWQVLTSNRFCSWCPFSFTAGTKGNGRVDIVNTNGEILKRIQFQVSGKSKPGTRVKHS